MYLLQHGGNLCAKTDSIITNMNNMGVKYLDMKDTLDEMVQVMTKVGNQNGTYYRGKQEELIKRDGIVILIINKKMLLDNNSCYYLEVVRSLFEKNKIVCITAVVEIELDELPERAVWLKETDIFNIYNNQDVNLFCYECVKTTLVRVMRQCSCNVLQGISHNEIYEKDEFIKRGISDYWNLDKSEVQGRVVIMKILFNYIQCRYSRCIDRSSDYGFELKNLIRYIFLYAGMSMPYIVQEAEIAEQCFLLAIHELATYNS